MTRRRLVPSVGIMTHLEPTIDPATGRAGRLRRWLEGLGFVAVWMALGWLLPLDANGYLLIGIPLTVAFQLIVRRRPLRELWVRDGPRFSLDRIGVLLAVLLMVAPVIFGVRATVVAQWTAAGWAAAAVVGAVAAGYALRQTSFLGALWAAAPATGIGVFLMLVFLGIPLLVLGQPVQPLDMLTTAATDALLYFAAVFVVEEVAFRGLLDSHVHHPGESDGWLSAIVVSALWALWHLPISPPGVPLWILIAQLLLLHCLVGVPLSFAWRRTGNLTAPGLAHAIIDGVRNGLLAAR